MSDNYYYYIIIFIIIIIGQYVQLVNGVLTHVQMQPSPPQSIVYSQPNFQVHWKFIADLSPYHMILFLFPFTIYQAGFKRGKFVFLRDSYESVT